jgi:hypothetical protein
MRTQVLFGQGFLKSQKPIVINQNPFQRIDEKKKPLAKTVRKASKGKSKD